MTDQEPQEPHSRTHVAVDHRLTVVTTIYHQVNGGDAHDIPSRYWRTITTDEQLYQRSMKAAADYRAVDLGWLLNFPIGLIHIENLDRQANLTISFDGESPHMRILPGESSYWTPVNPVVAFIRSNIPTSKFTISVVPE